MNIISVLLAAWLEAVLAALGATPAPPPPPEPAPVVYEQPAAEPAPAAEDTLAGQEAVLVERGLLNELGEVDTGPDGLSIVVLHCTPGGWLCPNETAETAPSLNN